MVRSSNLIDVYFEIGHKKTFAGAIDWPGWCRSGRDESSALQALFDYGARYAGVLHAAHLEYRAPDGVSAFFIVERLVGGVGTDFGSPEVAPASDKKPVDETELQYFQTVLKTYWQAFDVAVMAATGKELRKGPRGGGRNLEGILEHV